MMLQITSEIKQLFPDLIVLVCAFKNLTVLKRTTQLDSFKSEIVEQVVKNYTLESLKDVSVFKAYRTFFWRIGIDPTKIRPSAEALIRRILQGNPLPTINTLVDAYNLASIKTGIAIGVFDSAKFTSTLKMRFAKKNELFYGIGMTKAMLLTGVEIVVSENDKLVAIYPYRDADYSKVTETTKEALALICGVPGVEKNSLTACAQVTIDYITKFCCGEGTVVEVV